MQLLYKDGVPFQIKRSWTEQQGINLMQIHELADGSFAYADFTPVTDRAHFSAISAPEHRERAERWFDRQLQAPAPKPANKKRGKTGKFISKKEVAKISEEPSTEDAEPEGRIGEFANNNEL